MRVQRKLHRGSMTATLGFVMMATAVSTVSAQNKGSQVLRLPDPTPRELPPELRYPSNVATPTIGQKLTAAQNEKRWQLIVWATGEMVALSEHAEKAAQGPADDASKKELEGNLIKIDSLAKNLSAALKAH